MVGCLIANCPLVGLDAKHFLQPAGPIKIASPFYLTPKYFKRRHGLILPLTCRANVGEALQGPCPRLVLLWAVRSEDSRVDSFRTSNCLHCAAPE